MFKGIAKWKCQTNELMKACLSWGTALVVYLENVNNLKVEGKELEKVSGGTQ